MKKLKLLVFFFPCVYYSQEKIIRGTVTGSDNQPVAYAGIGITGTAYGTVADADGNFILYLPQQLNLTDTLKISCVGYKPFMHSASNAPAFLTVVLDLLSFNLQEITVQAKSTHIRVIGCQKENALMTCNFAISDKPNQNLGSEIGRKFFLEGRKHHINKLNIYSRFNFDTVLFRIHIYSLKKGKPDSSLLNENIIVKLFGPKIGWTEFDLKKYNLVYDRDIVVSLQWIGHSKKGRFLEMPISMPSIGAVHFYKFGSQSNWKRFGGMSTAMSLEVGIEN